MQVEVCDAALLPWQNIACRVHNHTAECIVRVHDLEERKEVSVNMTG